MIKELSRDQLEKNRKVPLTLRRSYRAKVIMDASSRVVGKERRDGIIRLTLKSRKLMKKSKQKVIM